LEDASIKGSDVRYLEGGIKGWIEEFKDAGDEKLIRKL